MNKYQELRNRQQKEFNALPLGFAFGNKQFVEMMQGWGLDPDKKLRIAQQAAEKNPAYQVNVDALVKAQPRDLDASEIEVRLGATWIDKSYIQQFMVETFRTPASMDIQVNYSPYTAEWFITNKYSVPLKDVMAYSTYGTGYANAYCILESSLNLRDVRIYDTVKDPGGKERRVLNVKATTLAAQKQQAIKDALGAPA